MECRNTVYLLYPEGYKPVMKTSLCIEDILEAMKKNYEGFSVLVTDDFGTVLYKTP